VWSTSGTKRETIKFKSFRRFRSTPTRLQMSVNIATECWSPGQLEDEIHIRKLDVMQKIVEAVPIAKYTNS
jgi:hypothetical protein